MVRLKKYIKKLIMGKFYEDLDTLNDLIKKLEKKNEVSIFMLRAIKYAKENPEKSVSDIIKDTKKGKI
jgi:cobyric acid synthase